MLERKALTAINLAWIAFIAAAAFILALILGAPAKADPVMTWGASSAILTPCRDADACVAVVNVLSASPTEVAGTVDLGGLVIDVHVVMGIGKKPDLATITAPSGYRVEPSSVLIEEGQSAVFRIWFPVMS